MVVIGTFDGVHLGHQEVLRRARELEPGPLAAVTFWPHPLKVVAPERAPKLLCDLHTRISLLKDAGAAEVRVVRFLPEVSRWTPAEFINRIIDPLRPRRVVVGDNFRFGHGASGDVGTLRELALGRFEVTCLELKQINRATTSSTLIREALFEGDMRRAAQHLGRDFRFRGVVVLGDQRGRDLGFPTANLIVPDELAVPADAVYIGYLTKLDHSGEGPLPAAISVGSNPTFDGQERRIEVHVLDRTDLELYGTEVAVDFVARLRGQIKYSRKEALIEQMRADVAQARRLLASG